MVAQYTIITLHLYTADGIAIDAWDEFVLNFNNTIIGDKYKIICISHHYMNNQPIYNPIMTRLLRGAPRVYLTSSDMDNIRVCNNIYTYNELYTFLCINTPLHELRE